MAACPPTLNDVRHGIRPSRLRLLAPLRYLAISNPEKTRYDFVFPAVFALVGWAIYIEMQPRLPLFGDNGLLKYTRDMLVMAVPFMVGALAAVAMGAPGPYLDKRPAGTELYLAGKTLTMRQFVCYMLGYLCFLGIVTLSLSVGADLLRPTVAEWTKDSATLQLSVRLGGALTLALLLSSLITTVFWSLYFLTDVVNRPAPSEDARTRTATTPPNPGHA